MSHVDEALSRQKINRHIVYTVSKFWSFPNILADTDPPLYLLLTDKEFEGDPAGALRL